MTMRRLAPSVRHTAAAASCSSFPSSAGILPASAGAACGAPFFRSVAQGLVLHRRWLVTNVAVKEKLATPPLRNPFVHEGDVPKTEMYDMSPKGSDGWILLKNKDDRPYYHHPESGVTQWAHPRTGIITPPAKPPEQTNMPNPVVLRVVRIVGTCAALTAATFIFGNNALFHAYNLIFDDSRGVLQARSR